MEKQLARLNRLDMTLGRRERSATPSFMAQTGRTLRDANPNDGFLAGIVCQQYRPSRKSSVATTFILVISITVRYFLDISFCSSQKFVKWDILLVSIS